MGKATILVVEDEKDLVRLLQYNLVKEGYRVIGARDAETGLALARKERPDLVLIDIMLPKMDGLEFCKLMRAESRVPAIFLTAKKNEVDRILGFKLGADDYITKPFSVGELLARIQAILRRSAAPSGPDGRPVRLGAVTIDFERHQVRVNGHPVELTPKEYELMKVLVEAGGKVLSRDHLLERVWGHDESAEIDTRTVDQHVSRLRRKLKAESSRIATVPNYGYQVRT